MRAGKEKSNLTRFYEGLAPMYVICRAAGIFPLRARVRPDGEIRMDVRKNDRVYFFTYLGIYTVLSVHSAYSLYADAENFNIVPHLVVFIETVIVLSLLYITVLFCFWYRRLLLDCVRLLAQVDSSLIRLGLKVDYKAARVKNLKVFGIMLTSVFLRSAVTIFSVKVDFVQQITLFSATFIKSLSKYQFIAMLIPIRERFQEINARIITDVPCGGKLYILCRLHYRLCNIARVLNACFACQLLSSLGVSLADVLFHSFYLYTLATKRDVNGTWAMYGSPIIWLMDECLEIYLLIRGCSNTSETANSTVILLHDLRNNITQNSPLEKDVEMYSLQMLHQKLDFSALGFFTIDYPLLYTIVVAVSTYLVIFIQFDQSQNTGDHQKTNST